MNSLINEIKNVKLGINSNVVQLNSDECVFDVVSEWFVKLDEGFDVEEI